MADFEQMFESNLAFHGSEVYNMLEQKLLDESNIQQQPINTQKMNETDGYLDEFEILEESERHIQDLLEAP